MKAIYFGFLLVFFGICKFCGDEFKVVGRHEWRCLGRNIEENTTTQSSQASRGNEFIPSTQDEHDRCNTDEIECACGRKCKGLRGIKRHQRSCRVIKDLSEHLSRDLQETAHKLQEEAETEVTTTDIPSFKPGIKLPKSDQAWATANDFFRANLPVSDINKENLDDTMRKFNDVVYNYMAES
eukprot:Seg7463.3 transcript_id=Seg7463.3/GoldUCD/mRNA.D3Y31 product="hypothetical protein" protein_id=Seg7463.3/GoldUCD/D3Y31